MMHPTSIHASHPTSTTPKIHRTSTKPDETGTSWHVFTHGSAGKKPHAFARISEQPEGMHLDLIKTHNKMKGKGIASKLLKHVNKWADKKQKPIFLDREPQDAATNDKRLKGFYEKHDFVSHPKKDKLMMRVPQ